MLVIFYRQTENKEIKGDEVVDAAAKLIAAHIRNLVNC